MINISPQITNKAPRIFFVFMIILGVSFFFSCFASIIFTRSVKKYAINKVLKKTTNLDNPKYSCIVVIHEPDKSVGYYGAWVSILHAVKILIFIKNTIKEVYGFC